MILLSILDQLNVSDTTLAIIAGSISAFFGGFFAILRLRMTKPEREADAAIDVANAFNILTAQLVKSGERSDKLIDRVVAISERSDADRDMYRQRLQKQDEEHRIVVASLERTQLETLEQLKDTNERVSTLQEIQDKLKIENGLLQRELDTLKAELKKERAENTAKDKEIIILRGRVTELESEVKTLKAQNQPAPIPVIVASIGATNEPADGEVKAFVASVEELKSEPVSPQPGESVTPSQSGEAADGA